jgi:cbb3-type cytochrome oxidase maturation protein
MRLITHDIGHLNICTNQITNQIVSVIFVLVGFSLLVALFFLGSFIWAIYNGQYEDDYTPSIRMLFDDEKSKRDESESNPTKSVNNKIA